MSKYIKRLNLQLFADGGEGGEGSATSGVTAPAAGESRLRELGVPEAVLNKRAKRQDRAVQAPAPAKQDAAAKDNAPEGSSAAPNRMTWDEIMADPEYNKQMQSTIQARLRSAKDAEDKLGKLAPALEVLSRKYGLDMENLDAEALAKAVDDDDSYYEDKALEMGVSLETAKQIDKNERETARKKAAEERTIQQERIQNHIAKLQQQGEALKQIFPRFDLATELRNPAFARMTSPAVNLSVEDAYYAVHRKEIQAASMQVTARRTAEQMANSIRSGQQRPVENGVTAQAPSNTSFDYAHASKEQREALKRQIRQAAAQGKKLYPGQH